MSKVYTSQRGRKFGITPNHRPGDEEIVYFTQREFDWMKSQNLSPEHFETLWLLKRDDFRYDPIPEEEKLQSANIGVRYAQEIKQMLRGNRGA